jgi:hypothetical protein
MDSRISAFPASAPALRVQLTKRPDGGAVLRATRRDGSVTWQRQDGPRAMFFPFHDLTHFAVETTLGIAQGFYGLLAAGWDISDTEGKGAQGPLPPETIFAEHMVGLFDRERVGGAPPLTAAEFNDLVDQLLASKRIQRARSFTDAELVAVRRRIDDLHRQWAELAPGGVLDLPFELSASSPR